MADLMGNLGNLMNKAKDSAASATDAPAASDPIADAVTQEAAPAETKKSTGGKRTPEQLNAIKQKKISASNVATKLSEFRKSVTQGKRALLDAVSKHAFIAGYVTTYNDKVDFFSKKNKGATSEQDTYQIGLKMFSPSAITGIIVQEPYELMAYFDNNLCDVPENINKIQALLNKPFGDPSIGYRTVVVARTEMPKYLLDYTNGKLKEHPEIVEAYVRGGKSPVAHAARDDSSALQVITRIPSDPTKLSGAASAQVMFKHTYRSKIVTPHNYISLKRYRTEKPLTTYSEEDASKHIHNYLSRFTKSHDRMDPKTQKKETIKAAMTRLAPESVPNFTLSDGGKVITASKYFATEGTPSWFADNSGNHISHWYDKAADGTAKTVPANAIQLVVKEVNENSEKGAISARFDELKSATAEGSYKLSDPRFATINKITGNGLTRDMLSVKSTTTKVGGQQIMKASSVFAGSDLMGLTPEQIVDALRAAQTTTPMGGQA